MNPVEFANNLCTQLDAMIKIMQSFVREQKSTRKPVITTDPKIETYFALLKQLKENCKSYEHQFIPSQYSELWGILGNLTNIPEQILVSLEHMKSVVSTGFNITFDNLLFDVKHLDEFLGTYILTENDSYNKDFDKNDPLYAQYIQKLQDTIANVEKHKPFLNEKDYDKILKLLRGTSTKIANVRKNLTEVTSILKKQKM